MYCVLRDCNDSRCHNCFPVKDCNIHDICINEGTCEEYNGKILITGSCGFIGSHLSELLLKNNYKIIGIDNLNSFIYDKTFKLKNLNILSKYKNYTQITSDFVEKDYIKIYKPNIIIHLAAYGNVRKSNEKPNIYINNNIEKTNILLEYLKNNKNINYNPLFIYASSSSVYGNNEKIPFNENDILNNISSVYALTKKTCEDLVNIYCKNYNIKSIGFRFFTVYGPRNRPDMAIYKFLNNIHNNKEIVIYNNKMKRDFTYIDDIVNGIYNSCKLILNEGDHKIYNLGNNNPILISELVKLCNNIVKKEVKIKYENKILGDVFITYADIEKAKNELNYIPKINIKEGLYNTYIDMLQNI